MVTTSTYCLHQTWANQSLVNKNYFQYLLNSLDKDGDNKGQFQLFWEAFCSAEQCWDVISAGRASDMFKQLLIKKFEPFYWLWKRRHTHNQPTLQMNTEHARQPLSHTSAWLQTRLIPAWLETVCKDCWAVAADVNLEITPMIFPKTTVSCKVEDGMKQVSEVVYLPCKLGWRFRYVPALNWSMNELLWAVRQTECCNHLYKWRSRTQAESVGGPPRWHSVVWVSELWGNTVFISLYIAGGQCVYLCYV